MGGVSHRTSSGSKPAYCSKSQVTATTTTEFPNSKDVSCPKREFRKIDGDLNTCRTSKTEQIVIGERKEFGPRD